MFNIRLLKALGGDCILVSYGQEKIHYILIDGGYGKQCFRQLNLFIDNIKKEENCELSAIILTHIDSDHIDGILKLLSKKKFDFSVIKQMWFNYGKKLGDALRVFNTKVEKIYLYSQDTEISCKQGNDLLKELLVKGIDEEKKISKISMRFDYNKSMDELCAREFIGASTLTNKSSIAFIFEYKGKKILLLGDADASIIQKSLVNMGYSRNKKIKIDYCKIAHHASRHNTSNELIQMINCSNYIISTHQTMQGRPSKECLSRVICNSDSKVTFYCNYDIDANKILTADEYRQYGMKFIIIEETGIDLEEIQK